MAPENLVLSLKVDRIVKSLFVTILVLSMASLTALGLPFYGGYEYAYGFVPLFAVDMEGNIPTYFSSLLHLSSVLLISLIAFDARQKGSAQRMNGTFRRLPTRKTSSITRLFAQDACFRNRRDRICRSVHH
ncbi:MAG: hypothetical protein ACPG3U_01700 [Rhodothermales bacterium]